MEKRQVAILYDQHLLGESLACLLVNLPDVEISQFSILDQEVLAHLVAYLPDVLLVAEENSQMEVTALLIGQILEKFPCLPVIHVKLSQDILQVLTSESFPARSADLLEVVMRLSKPSLS
jgi:chemotaxis response regulator CheB